MKHGILGCTILALAGAAHAQSDDTVMLTAVEICNYDANGWYIGMSEAGTFVEPYEIDVVQTDEPPGYYMYVRHYCPQNIDPNG